MIDPKLRALRASACGPDAGRLRQAGVVPRPRAPRVRDERRSGGSATGRWQSRPLRSPRTSSPPCSTSTRTRSSNRRRRYLYHAVVGAIALAHRRPSPPPPPRTSTTLLLPRQGRTFRAAVAEACAGRGRPGPDRRVLPGYRAARRPAHGSPAAPPRNASTRPATRSQACSGRSRRCAGWFSHPTDIPLREIIRRARRPDLMDANMGAIGEREQQGVHALPAPACCTPSCNGRSASP